MRSLYLLALTLLLSGVAGCAKDSQATIERSYVTYHAGSSELKEVQLADGTRCVVYVSFGITCEWQTPVVLVPRPQ